MPGKSWPNIADPFHPTADEIAEHTTRPGCLRPEDLPNVGHKNSRKMARSAMKAMRLAKLHKIKVPKRKMK